jgi:hypothetical protein
MYSTTAYLYQQKQQVLLIDTSGAYFDRRWQPVYTKNSKDTSWRGQRHTISVRQSRRKAREHHG